MARQVLLDGELLALSEHRRWPDQLADRLVERAAEPAGRHARVRHQPGWLRWLRRRRRLRRNAHARRRRFLT
eukprot:4244702-Prymnesium_polylepis.1